MNQNSYTQKSNIAIAGSSHRIGTTHLSLLLCRYFSEISNKVLYLEYNTTNFLREYLYYSGLILHPGINRLKEFHAGTRSHHMSIVSAADEDIEDFNHVIWDFGLLQDKNADEFMQFKFKFVLIGGKEWELPDTIRAVRHCKEDKDICFICNFIETGKFIKTAGFRKGLLKEQPCIRMPYMPEPFIKQRGEAATRFIEELLQYLNIEQKGCKHHLFCRQRNRKA